MKLLKTATAIGGIVALAVIGLPTQAAAAVPRWSAWHLCNTGHHNDYQVRMRITPVATRWSDTGVEVRRVPGHGPSYSYKDVWPMLFDGATRVSIQDQPVSLRNTSASILYPASLALTAANPRGKVMLSRDGVWVCESTIFGI
jgi:hypothetical protein